MFCDVSFFRALAQPKIRLIVVSNTPWGVQLGSHRNDDSDDRVLRCLVRWATVTKLLWFHAFRRNVGDPPTQDAGMVARVLRSGSDPNPSTATKTHAAETELGISGPCVYAYLGRTIERFGANAIVLPADAVTEGHMSPFDTGGLIEDIPPVCHFEKDKRNAFLAAFTFPLAAREASLEIYPSAKLPAYNRYRKGERPLAPGPRTLWPAIDHEGDIWDGGTHWSAWTWEARSPQKLDTSRLFKWTCAPSAHDAIVEAAEALYGHEPDWIAEMHRTYFRGGVGLLVKELEKEQAP